MSLFLVIIRLSLGTILLWSGIAKVRQPYDFLAAVYAFEMVGRTAGVMLAAILPWLEIIVACCLLGGILTSGATFLSTVLGGTFTCAIATAFHRGLEISCGCFGSGAKAIDRWSVLRSAMFLFASLVAFGLSMCAERRAPCRPPE